MKGKGNDVRLPDTHAMLPNYLVMSLGVEGGLAGGEIQAWRQSEDTK